MLSVTGDDYLMNCYRDEGILMAVRARRLSRVSVVVTHRIKQYVINESKTLEWTETFEGLAIGLHLNLTDGVLLSDPKEIPSLFDATCSFQRPHSKHVFVDLDEQHLKKDEVVIEINAQLDAFERLFGHPPDYIDGHQHCHVNAVVVDALIEVIRRRPSLRSLLPFRCPHETIMGYDDNLKRRSFYEAVSANAAAIERPRFDAAHVEVIESFVGMNVMGERFTVNNIRTAFQRLQHPNSVELMTHPGCVPPTLDRGEIVDFHESPDRASELSVLLSDEFDKMLTNLHYTIRWETEGRDHARKLPLLPSEDT